MIKNKNVLHEWLKMSNVNGFKYLWADKIIQNKQGNMSKRISKYVMKKKVYVVNKQENMSKRISENVMKKKVYVVNKHGNMSKRISKNVMK